MNSKTLTRRSVLKGSAAAAGLFTIVPSKVLGNLTGHLAPSQTHPRAFLGWGDQAHRDYRDFDESQFPCVATAEVDRGHWSDAHGAMYQDFRELLETEDLDVVQIASPPHWHALMSIAAAEKGIHVWCEKPMTRTIGEGIRVAEACAGNNTIFRINTWFRFAGRFYEMGVPVKPLKKAVMHGLLQPPITSIISANTGFNWKLGMWKGDPGLGPQSVPSNLDYDMWLGPAPFKPYNSRRLHQNFRGYWDYDSGGLGDMGQHYLDPTQYILGKDDTSPVKITPDPGNPVQHPYCAYPWDHITMEYDDGTKIILDGANDLSGRYLEDANGNWIGRGMQSNINNLAEELDGLSDPPSMNTDFTWCMEKGEKFALNEVNGFRSATLINLAVIAARMGRELTFDPVNLRFVDDQQANRYIWQPMRAPWRLPGETYTTDVF